MATKRNKRVSKRGFSYFFASNLIYFIYLHNDTSLCKKITIIVKPKPNILCKNK